MWNLYLCNESSFVVEFSCHNEPCDDLANKHFDMLLEELEMSGCHVFVVVIRPAS